jgi:hypothetical protein
MMELLESEATLRLFRIFESGATDNPLDEILTLVNLVHPDVNEDLIITFHQDIQDIFSGYFPGFRENGNKYHNLRHTFGVVLASARLFHGLTLSGYHFSSDVVLKGMLSAYFHDTGLLLRSFDTAENGAEYTKYHEVRSISSLFKYLETYDVDDTIRLDCGSIIRCTNLEMDIDSIEFSSEEVKLAGQILGTADILAQMADRYYLEQLPNLFQEHRAGGLQAYGSALDLMKDTTNFYHNFIVKRLNTVLGNTAGVMQSHFKHRWGIDKDPYVENIATNITYLQNIVEKCQDNLEDIYSYLRRRPPYRS